MGRLAGFSYREVVRRLRTFGFAYYRGRVKDGVVVLDDEVTLVEGAHVLVQLLSEASDLELLDENGETLAQKMLRFAGRAKGLPSDLARRHDHYLHSAPRQ